MTLFACQCGQKLGEAERAQGSLTGTSKVEWVNGRVRVQCSRCQKWQGISLQITPETGETRVKRIDRKMICP